jgi:hypothetical protein
MKERSHDRRVDELGRERERIAGQGDAEDRARLIVHRLRAGAFTPAQVELAAACGDEAASLALGRTIQEASTPFPYLLQQWLERLPLSAGDAQVRLRVGLAAVRTVHGLEPPGPARQMIDTLAAWIEHPADDTLRGDVLRDANRCGQVIRLATFWSAALGVTVEGRLGSSPAGPGIRAAEDGPFHAAVLACHTLRPDRLPLPPGDAMREVVCEELVAWALADAAPPAQEPSQLAIAQQAVWFEVQVGRQTWVMPRDPYPAH